VEHREGLPMGVAPDPGEIRDPDELLRSLLDPALRR
jgi:hypothetical protein